MPAPACQGPPGCEAYFSFLHPASYVSLILAFESLYPFIHVSGVLYVVLWILASAIWLLDSGRTPNG